MIERNVHAIVVAYHGAGQLERALSALEGDVDITVVDNSSAEDVRTVALSRGAEYLDAGENLGFAGGVNLALRSLTVRQPEHVLLLNPDAVLTRRNLDALVTHLYVPGNERVAAVSPRLTGAGGRMQRVVWPFPSPGRAWLEALGLARVRARDTFVVGAVLLLRWESLQEVGVFDERFFLYAEEADWQRRAADLGWSAHVCTDAIAEHVGAGASDDLRRRDALFHAAQETYVRKWYGGLGWFLYRCAACFGAAARAVVLTGERRSVAARRAVLYFRGPRRCAQMVE